MATTAAFTPQTSTYLVGSSAVQVVGSSVQYRVRNTQSTAQYFTYGTSSSITYTGAPSAGTPSANTIGMLASTVEVFTLGPGTWFIGNTAGAFEITGGEGL